MPKIWYFIDGKESTAAVERAGFLLEKGGKTGSSWCDGNMKNSKNLQ